MIYCDNTSTITLSKNSVFHQKNKHIATRYHFIREFVSNGEVHLKPCKSSDLDVFEFHKRNLGVISLAET